ncbi:beta-propeller fold lactonase family protein [Acanthopleuribacter pedis]|uniref:Beta-propeller fold lactonase family protein n=1 Tax=Acanthopleuribacter pedis TaxID=442870 RepID=A0A8J7U6A9_9BACT|nr:beta-propeller fold lactonase family protein [Acanthopleuribacter pedis]MBO1321268.1 beta-propeller fold lactonase family protein [Acanthopleuribacter pedis]
MFLTRLLLLLPLLAGTLSADYQPVADWLQRQDGAFLRGVTSVQTDRAEQYLYVLGKGDMSDFPGINVFTLPASGPPHLVQALSGRLDARGLADARRLVISPDDRHLYVLKRDANRQNGIGVFTRDSNNGEIEAAHFGPGYDHGIFVFNDRGDRVFTRENGRLLVLERDLDSGRLSPLYSYPTTAETPFAWTDITHAQWLPEQQMLLVYSPLDTDLALIQFNEDGEKTGVRAMRVDPNFLIVGHDLTHCEFSRDGRTILLAGQPRRLIYQLYLDLDRGAIIDFRATDLGPFDHWGGEYWDRYTHTAFHEDLGLLLLFKKMDAKPDVVEIGFPFAPNEPRAHMGFARRGYFQVDFFLRDGRFVTFPDLGMIDILNQRAPGAAYEVVQRYDQTEQDRIVYGPWDLAIAPNGIDVYIATMDSGLYHARQNPETGALTDKNHITCPFSDEAGGTMDHFFQQLELTDDGRFLYVQNQRAIRVLQRHTERGDLALIQRVELPFEREAEYFEVMAFTLTADQRWLLAFDSRGRIVAYRRDPESGRLTHDQNLDPGFDTMTPIFDASSFALTDNNTLFVSYSTGEVVLFTEEGEAGWTKTGTITAWPSPVQGNDLHALDFDAQRGQLWLRDFEQCHVFDWNATRQTLTHVDSFRFVDSDMNPIAPIGSLLFDENRVFFGSLETPSVFVLEQAAGRRTLIQRIDDSPNAIDFLRGIRALAVNPVGGQVLVGAEESRRVTVLAPTNGDPSETEE